MFYAFLGLFSFGLFLWSAAFVSVTHAASTWSESWQTLDSTEWRYAGGGTADWCATTRDGVLYSSCGQIFSIRQWDYRQPVELRGSVRPAQPAPEKFWCGLVLMQNSNLWGQVRVARGIAPPLDLDHPEWMNVALTRDEYQSSMIFWGYASESAWQSFVLRWEPAGTVSGKKNKRSRQGVWVGKWNGKSAKLTENKNAPISGPLFVDLQGGSHGCEFGSLEVTGTPI